MLDCPRNAEAYTLRAKRLSVAAPFLEVAVIAEACTFFSAPVEDYIARIIFNVGSEVLLSY